MCDPGNEDPALKKLEHSKDEEWLPSIRRLRLSRRQEQVVLLLMEGKQDKLIADMLDLSYSTIRTYLQRIYRKLGVNDHRELMLLVFAYRFKGRGEGGSGAS